MKNFSKNSIKTSLLEGFALLRQEFVAVVQETPVAPAQELTVQFFAELYLLFLIYRLTQMQLQEHTEQ